MTCVCVCVCVCVCGWVGGCVCPAFGAADERGACGWRHRRTDGRRALYTHSSNPAKWGSSVYINTHVYAVRSCVSQSGFFMNMVEKEKIAVVVSPLTKALCALGKIFRPSPRRVCFIDSSRVGPTDRIQQVQTRLQSCACKKKDYQRRFFRLLAFVCLLRAEDECEVKKKTKAEMIRAEKSVSGSGGGRKRFPP